jgi:hypothetical protein
MYLNLLTAILCTRISLKSPHLNPPVDCKYSLSHSFPKGKLKNPEMPQKHSKILEEILNSLLFMKFREKGAHLRRKTKLEIIMKIIPFDWSLID